MPHTNTENSSGILAVTHLRFNPTCTCCRGESRSSSFFKRVRRKIKNVALHLDDRKREGRKKGGKKKNGGGEFPPGFPSQPPLSNGFPWRADAA